MLIYSSCWDCGRGLLLALLVTFLLVSIVVFLANVLIHISVELGITNFEFVYVGFKYSALLMPSS